MAELADAFPTVRFTADELAAGLPAAATVARACALFTEHGALRLLDVYARGFLDELTGHVLHQQRGELAGTTREDRRPLYTVELDGPPGQPAYYANPMLLPVLQRLLGADVILGAVSTVLSFPGAPQQFIHRDSPWLFGDGQLDVTLPAYAITVLTPLVDANAETGSTRVWPGSHRIPALDEALRGPSGSPDVPHGSVLMTDSRVAHCGSPNISTRIRPLLYTTYHRTWFRDWGGYQHRPSVSISPRARQQVPAGLTHMFRVADESAGQPEGPAPLRRRLASTIAPTLRALRQRAGHRGADR